MDSALQILLAEAHSNFASQRISVRTQTLCRHNKVDKSAMSYISQVSPR